MKLKLATFFFFIISASYSQKMVLDITDKTDESKNNPAYDIRVIEPKTDTIYLNEQRIFSLVLDYKGELNSLHIIDYPTEAFADLNNLKEPATNEEYLALSDEEQAKFSVIVPKHEILKEFDLSRKIIRELKITSDRITHTEIYVDGILITTLYYQIN